MDKFDYIDEPSPAQKVANLLLNVLTVLLLLTTVCVVSVAVMIFANPQSSINPFPPLILPTAISLPTLTPTPRNILPATWTASPSPVPSATFTPEPTNTPSPSETPFLIFSPTVQQTADLTLSPAAYPFIAGPGTPVGTASQAFHPEAGCDWLGVAGQVFDLSGAAVTGQQVRIGGTLAGKPVDMLTLSGLTTAYGNPGYYEFVLANQLVKSSKTLWVQLIDQAGLAMSERIYFETYDDCTRNLIIVNFKQVR